jgi:tRNA CCA-adding enzyme
MKEITDLEAFNTVVSEILMRIKPSPEELIKIQFEIDSLIQILASPAPECFYHPKVIEPHGSTGIKQTQLRNDSDIDLFIGFDISQVHPTVNIDYSKKIMIPLDEQKEFFKNISNEVIIPRLVANGYSDVILSYAEHPYVSAVRNSIQIDVVGYYSVPKEHLFEFGPVSAVDRTPYHSKYVIEHVNDQIRDDIRVMKYFMKQSQAYGEKALVGHSGFIGYALELVMIHFGSLKNFCQRFDEIETTIIDPFSRTREYFRENPRYVNDSLIIMDPVDKQRNVGASIDIVSYRHISNRIQDFINAPSLDHFNKSIPDHFDFTVDTQESLSHYYFIELRDPNRAHFTIIRDKLHSLGIKLIKFSDNRDLKVEFKGIQFEALCNEKEDRYSLLVYVDNPTLSPTVKIRGPKIETTKEKQANVEKFRQKHGSRVTQEGNFLFTELERKFVKFYQFFWEIYDRYGEKEYEILSQGLLSDFINQPEYVSENIRKLYYALSRIIIKLK